MGMDSVYRLSVVLGLVDNMSKGLSSTTDRVKNSTKAISEAFGTVQKAGAVLGGIGASIVTAGYATVQSTFETQDALGELASLGVTDLEAVESAAKSFSDTWAGTTKSDFITAAYDIKSGIASLTDEGVADFTELAALTGKATKSTTEEMGSLFATGYGIYKGAYEDMSDLDFGEMFSAGISTAVKNYKTAGTEMASAISVLGATATNNKISMEEQLAILGQLQTTMSGSEAATKYKAFLNAAASAGEKLGLSFVDANNQLLGTPEILTQLQSKYGDTIDAVEKQQLKEAFGTDEAVAMIDLLYNDIGGLENGIDSLAVSMKSGIGVTKEMAQAINDTPAQKMEVLKQKIHNNVEELGNNLLPAFNETLEKVDGLIQKGSEWMSENQETVSTLMNVGMKLGVILIVAGSLIGIIGTVGKTVNAVSASVKTLKSAWLVLNGAFAASPVGWIVIAILGLVAAFAILWNKSESFQNFWTGLFNDVKSVVMDTWQNLQPHLQGLGQNLMKLYEASKPILKVIGEIAGAIALFSLGTIVGTIQGILAALAPLTDALSSLISFITNVVNIVVALFNGDFSGACDFAMAAVDDLVNFFSSGFEAILSFVGGFADGFLNVMDNALSAVGIDASGAIEGIKSTVSGGLEKVKGIFNTTMTAAGDSVKEKLSNIKAAYEENGGGIHGVVAASMEGIKGAFTIGLTFIDNVTGGKLTAIKAKFTQGLEGAKNIVSSTLTGIKDKFNEKITGAANIVKSGIEKIKNLFHFSWKLPNIETPHFTVAGKFSLKPPSVPQITTKWFAEGGVMTSPTIFGSSGNELLGGGEAGDEAILPLSSLWDKMGQFIHTEMNGGESAEKSESSYFNTITEREMRSVSSLKEVAGSSIKESHVTEKEGKTVIQKLEIKVDLKNIKELKMLEKLINELTDAQNSSGEPEPT